jgi:holo-[acyl-carrier protein] synthase
MFKKLNSLQHLLKKKKGVYLAKPNSLGKLKEAFGVGIDIEGIQKFKKLTQKKNGVFLKRVYSAKELAYCFSKPSPAQHLAVRFAAKEAVIKALYQINAINATASDMYDIRDIHLNHNEITILKTQTGSPAVLVTNKKLASHRIRVSLSHSGNMAVAVAIVLGGKEKKK